MSGHIETVKSRVIFLLVMFALIITVLALIFSFNITYDFQRRIMVSSAEFNLQLVANLIEQDIRELTALSLWCGHNSQIIDYFLAEDQLIPRSINAWNLLSEQYINNRAGRYVRRLLVCDSTRTRFLQVGGSLSSSFPVTIYNIDKFFETGAAEKPNWQTLERDPFIFTADPLHIPFVYPVYNPRDGNEIGTVFLSANTGIITDKLRGYELPARSQLYLGIGGEYYLIENEQIIPGDFSFTIIRRDEALSGETDASVLEGRDSQGKRHTLVSYPIRDEIVLTHVFDPMQFVIFSWAWPALIAGLGVLIVLLVIMAYGVNRMALEITTLMNKALIDETNKRDLEYRMLQSQINPHFLYNTLNSIRWMATIQNATGIAEMTIALSRFLKIISKDSRKIVPLREELALLDDYLVIQKYRYGDSVNFEKQITEEALLDIPIPRFILQPLMENAIFHGIEPKGNGNILFSAFRQGIDVLISLSDDGVGMGSEAVMGMGLLNIDERLRHTFGDSYGITIKSEAELGTTITIRLPGGVK
jgi:two-component system sensor histidine kinase YesM